MYDFKRILVGLDLSELDETLIGYCNLLAEILPLEKIYFFHVAKTLELPEETRDKYPDLLAPMDESIKSGIQHKIDSFFNNKGVEYEVLVAEGNPTEKIIKWSGIKEVDLLVMGRKTSLKGSGVLPGKLTKVLHCSLLFVPENFEAKCKKILVPVDFSNNSAMAIKMATKISDQKDIQVVALHSYEVPTGYHATGKSYDEFAEIMRGHAINDYKKFTNKNGIDGDAIPCLLKLNEHSVSVDDTINNAEDIKADMIVMASKGRSSMANFILGSFAEKMTLINNKIPLLVVKNKADNLSFFEALLKL